MLSDAAALERIIAQPVYTPANKARIIELLTKHRVLGKGGPFFLQETRRRLVSNGRVVANGRADWVGWIEWRHCVVSADAIENTGRIIRELHADILCLVEVESRPVLREFNERILREAAYPHIMLIDGNDSRGIDVAVASRWPIRDMRSHVDDIDPETERPLFSRDCAEFEVEVPRGQSVWVVINHFKSRGYGSRKANDAKRRAQATRVAEIVGRFDLAQQWVIVAGDFNELPNSRSLAPLLRRDGLRNVLRKLPRGADKWTHRDDATPSKNNQIDYLLVSDALWPHLRGAKIERRGIWAHTQKLRGRYAPLATITDDTTAASDHAAVVAEFVV